jgi:uncharacterized membrane protein
MSDPLESSDSGYELPPASLLASYPPAMAEAFIKMVQKEQEHKHVVELERLRELAAIRRSELNLERRGQWFACIIGLAALATSAFLGYHDKQVSSTVIGGGGIIGLVSAFLVAYSRRPAALPVPGKPSMRLTPKVSA